MLLSSVWTNQALKARSQNAVVMAGMSNSASASAPVASPTVPKPKPSAAPPDLEELPPAESAQSVQSSASEVQDAPNLALLSPAAAFDLLHSDFISLSPRQVATWWSHDHMTPMYKVMSGPWSELLQQHAAVHFLSEEPDRMAKLSEDESVILTHSGISPYQCYEHEEVFVC
eukprot:666607-Amphidinium_carterae.1